MNPLMLIPTLAAGALIYEGRVHAPDAAASAPPLYTYERRIAVGDDGLLDAAHITRDAQGATLIVEAARVTPAYALRRFEADNRQQRYRGTVTVSDDGRRLHYELLRDNGTRTRADERIDAPAVSGPSLHGFILQHWDALAAGAKLPVRMVVLDKTTSYGFTIRRHQAADAEGRRAFSVTPSNWLLRFAIAPLVVTFDERTRQVVRYDGRVPPQRIVEGRALAFDARVDYRAHAPAYR
jgi:hypothetical protein